MSVEYKYYNVEATFVSNGIVEGTYTHNFGMNLLLMSDLT